MLHLTLKLLKGHLLRSTGNISHLLIGRLVNVMLYFLVDCVATSCALLLILFL